MRLKRTPPPYWSPRELSLDEHVEPELLAHLVGGDGALHQIVAFGQSGAGGLKGMQDRRGMLRMLPRNQSVLCADMDCPVDCKFLANLDEVDASAGDKCIRQIA